MPRTSPPAKAILIARSISDLPLRATTLARIAAASPTSDEYAFHTLELARSLATSENNSGSRCYILCEIAIAEHAMGLSSRDTLQSAEQAAMDAIGDVRPLICFFLAEAQIGLEAIRNLRLAFDFARDIPDKPASTDAVAHVVRRAAELGHPADAEHFARQISSPLPRVAAYCEIAATQSGNDCRQTSLLLNAAKKGLGAMDSRKDICEARCLLAVAAGLTGGTSNEDLTCVEESIADFPAQDDRDYITCQLAATYGQLSRWTEAEAKLKMLPMGLDRDSALTAVISSLARDGQLSRAMELLEEVTEPRFRDSALKHIALATARLSLVDTRRTSTK
jgi:hypothetical protein